METSPNRANEEAWCQSSNIVRSCEALHDTTLAAMLQVAREVARVVVIGRKGASDCDRGACAAARRVPEEARYGADAGAVRRAPASRRPIIRGPEARRATRPLRPA